ncbi:protein-methionine-sulfoxide reductase heme-binding subunit MsrQ [Thioclava sp. BHET1]|nr:protein-methionine-sulfoxide reductase heme-binding subunit MsrQ [Thioclava sp. BHET1]
MAQGINTALRRVPTWPVYLAGLIPFGCVIYWGFTGGLGVDPTRTLELFFGIWTLRFLLGGLCVTPLRRWTGVSLLKYRRALGLLAFLYVLLHVATWLFLDIQLRWSEIGSVLLKNYFIIFGMLGFVMLIPLALPSNALSIRKLGGRNWARLPRLVYPVALLGAVHFLLALKAFPKEPLIYLTIALVLVGIRLIWSLRRRLMPARAA